MDVDALLQQLNNTDELTRLEAKRGGSISRSVMETVCAFANEPDLAGGTILLGVVRNDEATTLFPTYEVVGVDQLDKLQAEIATQGAGIFNLPIRPRISVEQLSGRNVILIEVDELHSSQKPLYFKTDGLPSGAYRRIGTTDQRCTEDDLSIFYTTREGFDSTLVNGTSFRDVDEIALSRYRALREKVNAGAEELTYNDADLLEALNAKASGDDERLTVAGLLLFGTSRALRRHFPMMRIDYIRVPGITWMEDVDQEFINLDLRGPLFLTLPRIVNEVYNDLPRAFRLEEGDLQANAVGLPSRALREAITNAVMHRSYRVQSAIQVIRYDNRIEIINPGYSLKDEERLGEPKSITRNGFIAAAFHETNLAETKGTGIKRMRRLLTEANLSAPTFESSREHDEFKARLLLHHFFTANDLAWLSSFGSELSEAQRQALVFLREVGAIDNLRFRQLTGVSTLDARKELALLLQLDVVSQKGRGRGTYYVPTPKLLASIVLARRRKPANELHNTGAEPDDTGSHSLIPEADMLITRANATSTRANATSTRANATNTGAEPLNTGAEPLNTGAEPLNTGAEPLNTGAEPLNTGANIELNRRVASLRKRELNPAVISQLIEDLCQEYQTSTELAVALNRNEDYLIRKFLQRLIREGRLVYRHPDMPTHPQQAYIRRGETAH